MLAGAHGDPPPSMGGTGDAPMIRSKTDLLMARVAFVILAIGAAWCAWLFGRPLYYRIAAEISERLFRVAASAVESGAPRRLLVEGAWLRFRAEGGGAAQLARGRGG